MSALFAVPGRAEEDAVLARDDRDHQEADDLVLAEELPLERAREDAKALVQGPGGARRPVEARRGVARGASRYGRRRHGEPRT